MHRLGSLLAATLVLLLLTAAASAQPASSPPTQPDLSSLLDNAVTRGTLGQFRGAVLVARAGRPILAKGYGVADEALHPITADSLFDIGSVSKQFTAAAILQLDSAGKLHLDEPVSRFFPHLPDRASKITLRHLLNHTSGMSDESAIQRLDFPDRDEAVRLAFSGSFASEPGKHWEYCNAGYIVLAAVVEAASGEPFQRYMIDHVFRPAGMKNTGFMDGDGIDPSRGVARDVAPHSFDHRRTDLKGDGWGWGLRGAGGICTSLNDLLAWDRALNGTVVITAAASESMFRPALNGYAMGWFVTRTAHDTRRLWHTGGTRGFTSMISRLPDDDALIVILSGEGADLDGIHTALMGVLFPEEAPGLDAVLHLQSLALNRYGAVDVPDGAVAVVTRQAGNGAATIQIRILKKDKPLAEIRMRPASAVPLRAQLEALLADTVPADGPAALSVELATKPYTVSATGDLTLPAGLTWNVMDRYVGVGENGQQIIDERTTIVLIDRDNRFWPVILKADGPAAAALLRDLRTALAR